MNEIPSILIGLAGAIIVLVAIPVGLGLAMHFHTRYPRLALPTVAALLAVVPPIGVILAGRNLSVRLDFTNQLDAGGLSAWIFRLTSAGTIVVAITIVIVYLMRREHADNPAGRWLLFGFIAYFVTNVLLNGAFGTQPALIISHGYALLVMMALYASRTAGLSDVITALKWGLFLSLAAGIAFMVVGPQLVMQTNTPEVRLPFVNFRFWGLGDGPNSTAPLALTLILLTLYQPFRWRILTLASLAAGGGALLLAQSMTTWLAAAVVLPGFMVINYLTHPEKGPQRRIQPFAVIGLGGLFAAAVLGTAALVFDLNEVERGLREFVGLSRGQENAAFTGRGGIWAVAIRTFLDSPIFGFGPTAWDAMFRARINMGFAFHAHNLVFQALSVGGLLGLAGMLFHVSTMGWFAWRCAAITRGLAPALYVMLLFRGISEAPLELGSILTGNFLMQVLLFHVLVAGAWELSRRESPARAGTARGAAGGGRTPIVPPAPLRPGWQGQYARDGAGPGSPGADPSAQRGAPGRRDGLPPPRRPGDGVDPLGRVEPRLDL